jgi:hypothetical protein
MRERYRESSQIEREGEGEGEREREGIEEFECRV